MKVYLAGGMRSGWQKYVKEAVSGVQFIDPRLHFLDEPDEYTTWDLMAIRRCDLVFAYLERTNPSGMGLALEIGYAKALGKPVILVNEKTGYIDMLKAMADVTYTDLNQGAQFLQSLNRMEGE